jgi:hypothetical protein
MRVSICSWLLLWVVGNARTSIYCPLSALDAVPRFDVFCTRTKPCNDVDIYCPASSYTDLLWLDCNGAHACVNVSVYTSVSSHVRCRGRSGACEDVNVHCGDVESIINETIAQTLFSDENYDLDPISCKFRHLVPFATQNTFFGCYGSNVGECISTGITDHSYSDSQLHCGTTNTPCVMDCRTSSTCTNNQIRCAASDPSLCQCEYGTNCDGVEFIYPGDSIATTSAQTETETETETTTTSSSVSTTTTQIVSTDSTDFDAEAAKQPVCYYAPMHSDDYISDMILAANHCNTYRGTSSEESYKVSCNNAGSSAGVIHYFSDAKCTQPVESNSGTSNYPCIVTNSVKKSQVASITRYIMKGANKCTSEADVLATATESSTYYLSMGSCAAYGHETKMWHQFTCQNGVLSHSLYSSSNCNDQSFVTSDGYINGACQVNIHGIGQMQTQYLQINCSVYGYSSNSDTTTSKAPISSTTTSQVTQSSTTTTEQTSQTSTNKEATTTQASTSISGGTISTAQPETGSTTTTQKSSATTSAATTSAATNSDATATSTSDAATSTATVSTSTTASGSVSSSTSALVSNSMTTTMDLDETNEEITNYQHNDKKSALKVWQLVLVIVLPCIAISVACFIFAFAIQRWRNGHEEKHGQLSDEENQLVMNAPKDFQTTTDFQITTETQVTTGIIEAEEEEEEEEHQHNKSISAQSTDLAIIPSEIAQLNTAVEGDQL